MVAKVWQGLLVLRKVSVVSRQIDQQQGEVRRAGG